MMFHASISAYEPERVAKFVAAIWQGEAHPFPPCPGAFVALANDERGTLLEVNPFDSEMIAGDVEVGYVFGQKPSPQSSSHQAVATPLTEAQVLALAEREGWPARVCWRGSPNMGFGVIEVWIESRILLEVLTAQMQAEYLKFMKPGNWAEFLSGSQA